MIPRPTDMPVIITVCGVFQLGSTLGTREISAKQMINTEDLSGGIHGKYHREVLAPLHLNRPRDKVPCWES